MFKTSPRVVRMSERSFIARRASLRSIAHRVNTTPKTETRKDK